MNSLAQTKKTPFNLHLFANRSGRNQGALEEMGCGNSRLGAARMRTWSRLGELRDRLELARRARGFSDWERPAVGKSLTEKTCKRGVLSGGDSFRWDDHDGRHEDNDQHLIPLLLEGEEEY